MSDIDLVRREEIIETSAEMTRDIPGAMLFGGNANRVLYEAYTGKTMFGVGKNDADIYVPQATFDQLLIEQPAGYDSSTRGLSCLEEFDHWRSYRHPKR